MALNDDDDDHDEVVDLSDGYNKDGIPGNADDANVAEDDLLSLSVCQVVPTDLEGEVVLSIESGGDRIALWEAVPAPPPGKRVAASGMTFQMPEELPKALIVEGVKGSGGLRDVTLVARFEKAGVVLQDTVKLTVLKVDIQVDGTTEETEEDPGAFFSVNEDDDDEDGVIDVLDADGVVGPEGDDDDLREVTLLKPLSKEPEFDTVKLTWTQEPIHFYFDAQKMYPVVQDGVHNVFAISELPKHLYVEGVSPGWHLYVKVEYTTGGATAEDEANTTAMRLRIVQNEQDDITNTTQDWIVGKRVSLEALVSPDGLNVSSRHWDIPGNRIAEYVIDLTPPGYSGTVYPLTNLGESSLSFFWLDGSLQGLDRIVTHSVVVGGLPLEASATFKVKRPEATMTSRTASVGLADPLSLRFGDLIGTAGIRFDRTIEYPEGFGGKTEFLQKYSMLRRADFNQACPQTGRTGWHRKEATGLDGGFPYGPNQDWAEDSPGTWLYASLNEATADDQAEMYWMFKPEGTENQTIYVPLKVVRWRWAGQASSRGYPWRLDSDPNDHYTHTDETPDGLDPVPLQEPTWEFLITETFPPWQNE